jgi:hypothetical protein
MAFTSSWTEDAVRSPPSTGVASTVVAATTGAATTGAAATGAAAFLEESLALVAGDVASAETTGVATTGAAGAAVVFLETVFLEAGAEAFIILVAVEVFMAGIRTLLDAMESIFGPHFIFGRAYFFIATSSQHEQTG